MTHRILLQTETWRQSTIYGSVHFIDLAYAVYRRRSNYAFFLILHQNTTFQTGNFQ